ncbi:MAG TPA: cupin domain-containing protein [Miltoncostaeaceae bacterium]|nr:cupin domain-containing protein [Miltoncostaeaceae bacterium]
MSGARRISLAEATTELAAGAPDGFRAARLRIGHLLGARRTGASLYEIPPGQAVCPYHYEYGEEEWVLVLEGHPTLRTPDGTERLDPLDIAFFPTGPEGAHQIRNDAEATARVLMWSEVAYPGASGYPDSGKVGVWSADRADDLIVRRSSAVDYYDGEV